MAFKKNSNGIWAPVLPTGRLDKLVVVGVWNSNQGGGRFAPVMRDELDLAQKARLFKKAGAWGMEFHNTDVTIPELAQAAHILREEGLVLYMVTANLFKARPEYAQGNFTAANPSIRWQAIQDTLDYIVAGKEHGAQIAVCWNASAGLDVPLALHYANAYYYFAWCLAEVIKWQISYEKEKEVLPLLIEPRSYCIPADVGEAQAIISLMPLELQQFVGFNPETCNSQLAGKRFAIELGLACALGKNWYGHLNGGTGLKFDEDRAFGDGDFGVAVETVYTLIHDNGYEYPIGLDVQPLNTDSNTQQAASVERSIRNLRRAMIAADRINPCELNKLREAGNQAEIAELFAAAVSGISTKEVDCI